MNFDSWKSELLPTQRDVANWALVWVVFTPDHKALPLSTTPSHPPPNHNECLHSFQQVPHLTSRHLGNLPLISARVLWHHIFFSPDLGILFYTPLAALARGSEDWSEPILYNTMCKAYCALNSGNAKCTNINN
jgi:hypothetical protein